MSPHLSLFTIDWGVYAILMIVYNVLTSATIGLCHFRLVH